MIMTSIGKENRSSQCLSYKEEGKGREKEKRERVREEKRREHTHTHKGGGGGKKVLCLSLWEWEGKAFFPFFLVPLLSSSVMYVPVCRCNLTVTLSGRVG